MTSALIRKIRRGTTVLVSVMRRVYLNVGKLCLAPSVAAYIAVEDLRCGNAFGLG